MIFAAIEMEKNITYPPRQNAISKTQLLELKKLIKTGETDKFYFWSVWKKLSKKVKELDNYECQKCKAKGRYRRGEVVHHKKHLKDYPGLALDIYDENGERQLITLCRDCHTEEHPEHLRKKLSVPLTRERWD